MCRVVRNRRGTIVQTLNIDRAHDETKRRVPVCGSSSARQADVEETPISTFKLCGTGHQINYMPHRVPVLEAREDFRAPSVSQRLGLPQSWRPSEVSLKTTSEGCITSFDKSEERLSSRSSDLAIATFREYPSAWQQTLANSRHITLLHVVNGLVISARLLLFISCLACCSTTLSQASRQSAFPRQNGSHLHVQHPMYLVGLCLPSCLYHSINQDTLPKLSLATGAQNSKVRSCPQFVASAPRW